jgi:hypothetical protein
VRKYGWLGFLRKGIGPLFGCRSIQTSIERDPCTKQLRLHIFWSHWKFGCHWIISIMSNGFVGTGWGCFWTNVQAKFGSWGKRECKATCYRRRVVRSSKLNDEK